MRHERPALPLYRVERWCMMIVDSMIMVFVAVTLSRAALLIVRSFR